jgi:hypothetical protein
LNTSQVGALTGSVTVSLASDGTQTDGLGITPLVPQTVTVSGTVFREAAGQVTPSAAIVHVGGPETEALVVSNTDPADGLSEGLRASLVSSSGAISASGGSTGLIAAGASDDTSLSIGFSTATAGVVSGDVSLDYVTDGTGTSGLAPLDLGVTTTPVSIAVDNYATAALAEVSGPGTLSGDAASGYTLNLGSVQLGSTAPTVDLEALNTATDQADLLEGSFSIGGADSSAFTDTGFDAFSGLAAGQSDTAPTVTLNTSAAGTFSETITFDPTGYNASGYSGALAPETLTITGAVVGAAQATTNTSSPIVLASARVGSSDSQTLSISNSAVAPADALDASVGSTSGGATASGAFTGLAPGATDASDITVGLNTSQAGAQSGSVTLNLASDAGGGNVTALPSQTVQVSGNVYREASASVAALPSDIIVHVGDTVSDPLTITNTAANDGYSENLIASVAGVSGAITASGATGDIGAQASSNAIDFGFSTASAGNVSGSVTLALQSDGTGIDGFSPTSIGQQTVQVNATVDNYASAALQKVSGTGTLSGNAASGYTLDLGTVLLGASAPSVSLAALNAATGQADLLEGGFSIGGADPSAFTDTGFGAFSGLAAGQSDTVPMVSLNTSQAGTFSETITFDPTGYNASGYASALAPETLTVTGTVVSSVPVSDFLANQSSLDALGSFTVKDSWANVLAQLGALSADPHVTSIELTDPTAPAMTLSVAQALNDARALSILSAPWAYALTISDAPGALAGLTPTQIAALKAEGIASIAATGSVVLSIADAAAYEQAGFSIGVPLGDTVTVADTAADIAAITQAQANALKTASYKSIASTNGTVTLTTSAALVLEGDGLKVTGGAVTVADLASNLLALTPAQSAALLGLGEKLTVVDSAAGLAGLLATQIAALKSEGVTAITATGSVGLTIAQAIAYQQAGFTINVPQGDHVSIADAAANIEQLNNTEMANLGAVGITSLAATDVGFNLTLAQALAFQNAELTLSAPVGDSVAVVDTLADLGRALTVPEIDDLPGLGVSRITVTNGNLSLSAAQTAAINANDLAVTAEGSYSVTETAQANETFVFQPGFGQSVLNGFDASGASNEALQFSVADFSYLSGTNAATDLAALIAHGAITQSATSTLISDTHGDTLKLAGVAAATLEAHSSNFAFK